MTDFSHPVTWGWFALGAATVLFVARKIRHHLTVPPPVKQSQPTKGNPADSITMVQLGPGGAPMVGSVSPFCVKLELILRMSGLPFTVKDDLPNSAPNGKMPYLRHGDTVVGDSTLAAQYLANTYGAGFGGKMLSLSQATPEQRGLAVAVQRLLENDVYYGILHTRWLEDYGFSYVCRVSFNMLPGPLRTIVARIVRRKICQQVHTHGMGTMSHTERVARVEVDLAALAAILGDKQWFVGGDLPSVVDACAFAMLEQIYHGPRGQGEWMSAILARHSNLTAFVDRVQKRYFGTTAAAGAGASAGTTGRAAGSKKQA